MTRARLRGAASGCRGPACGRRVGTVLLALAAGACGGESAPRASSAAPPDILRVAYEREIDVLNALTSQNLADIQFSMVEGLVTTDDENRYVPVLATTIPTEENGLVARLPDGGLRVTWPLREGVRWHDGAPFTSADVCFTWRFVTSEGAPVYNRDQYLGIVACDDTDPLRAVFTWDAPYGYYAGLFEAILPQHVLGGLSTEEIVNHTGYNRGDALVGTGPFRFAEWRAGEFIRVVRNDDYWRGADVPAIREIVWSFVPDSNTRLTALKAGLYDFARIEPTQVEEARALPDYETVLVSSNSFMHFDLSLNTPNARALFGDPAVREALFHAIDREAIARDLMRGTVRVAEGPIHPSSPFYTGGAAAPGYDPARAAAMLEAAGWKPGPDGVRERDGRPFSFTLLNRAGAQDRIAVAQVIQAQLKAVGVEARFETLESASWTQRWRTRRWEALVSAWFLPADPSLTGLYACDGPNNMTGFCDEELDRALRASDRELDVGERRRLLAVAQARLAADQRMLPLYYNVVPEVVSRRVRGYRGSGTNFGSFWNLWSWRLEAP